MKKAIIIGSGFGGLSCASLLSKDGYDVTILEKNKDIGGRARVLKAKGFTFDMGPSWYLMPEVFDDFFSIFNKKTSDYYKLIQLKTQYRMFFGKEKIDIVSDLKKNVQLFESFEKDGGRKFLKYLRIAKYQYEIAMKNFVYKNYSSIFDFFSWDMLIKGAKLNVFSNLDKYTKKFFKSDRLRKVLLYTTVFLGGSPKKTPALYSIMSHVDFNQGVYYPDGGLGSVVKGFEKLAKENNCTIKNNCDVKKIVVKNKKVQGVITQNGDFLESDIVVSNADYAHTEMNLLDSKSRSFPKKYWDKRTIAPSGFIIYLGLNKKLKNLKHHNLFLANDWMKHFETIFDKPAWPKDPSYYVCAPSITDKKVAPKNKENLFFLVPVAAGLKDDSKLREKYSEKIISDFEVQTGNKIKKDIIFKKIFAQSDFAKDYNAFKGTALGLSHSLMQTAIFRPPNKSKKVKNLYYTGHFTNPGVGVPMVIISSQIVRDLIRENDK